ncbi:hypothetical protein OTU49_005800, partial [Cherax quadricarinatus]
MKRAGSERKITSFFKTKVIQKSDDGDHDSNEPEKHPGTSTSTAVEADVAVKEHEDEELSSTPGTLTLPAALVDVASFIGNKVATDAKIMAIIYQKAPSAESLPLCDVGGHRRRFQPSWCSTYPWLKYSQLNKGGYCIACVVFGGDTGRLGDQRLGILVLKPMCKYRKATEVLNNHNACGYHAAAMSKIEGFVDTVRNPTRAVDTMLHSKRKEQVETNRRLLVPVIETILFCGRNMLPLRGHRDDGPLDLSVLSKTGEGVFRALLRYRAQGGDSDLTHLLTSSVSRTRISTLISKTIQNELINITGILVQEEILAGVSGVYAVLMDETTDVSGKEQATIIIRHVKEDVKEDFLAFVHAHDLTGEGLAQLLIHAVEGLSLEMSKCRGLGFDGASAMMGKFRGCAAIIMQQYPLVKPIHCFSHRLNLVLTKACDVKEVKLTLQTLNEVYNFIHSSNMRTLRFTKLVKLSSAKREKLVPLCPTRWVERHDAVLVFIEFLPLIAIFLEDEMKLDANAGLLLAEIRDPRFLVGLVVAESVLAHMLQPSRTLQKKEGDLVCVYALIREIGTLFSKFRADAEEYFHAVFVKAK